MKIRRGYGAAARVFTKTCKPSNSISMDSSSQTTASAAAFSGGGNGTMIQLSNDASPMESYAAATTTTTVAAAGIPTVDPKQNLTQVINSIQKTLGILHQLYLNVSSFNVASQLALLQRMNNLVLELDNMTRLAKNCNIQVPMDVLNLIDDGKNPDKFAQDMLNGCIAKNQIIKGKKDSLKSLLGPCRLHGS
ncbi:mediator of RNA polymerase II transcription subunit 10b-like isoform X2 [Henckelia pumila]|uniref:mediator of RNA polymerase II transcription subunit 10b-like isoform X2 n=1 Tax=Henckelia pumila TaxID=405737 RepID=UPI003C6DE147